jgi:hypothetical protein
MKKLYTLLGVIAIGAVIAIGLVGCDNGSTDDNGGGVTSGGGDNPLLGTWVNDLALTALGNVFVFTDEPVTGPGIAANTKLAYYASVGGGPGADYVVNGQVYTIPVGGQNYTADITSLGSNKFTLTSFVAVVPTTNPDGKMDFKRAPGTTGSQLQGIWVSDLTTWGNTNAGLTIILIGGPNYKKVWSANGAASASDANYRATEDAGTTYISWNGGANTSYTKRTVGNSTTLSITPPVGGGAALTVNPLDTRPTF